MSLEEHLSKFPDKKPLPRNVIDCNHLIRKQRKWKEDHEKLFKAKVSQIQDRIDKLIRERNKVPLLEINKQALLNTRILELEWVHFLITGETYKALLEGSPSQLSKAEIEDVELSYKQIQEGKVFKSDNVEEAITELKKEGSAKVMK